MTVQDMLLNQKLNLLQLAEKLNNIRLACNYIGVSRSFYYKVKKKYEKLGIEGLKPTKRRKPKMPNQTSPEIEKQIIEYSLQHPMYGRDRVSIEMKMKGIYISASGVESIWKRNNMENRKKRVKKLEEKVKKEGIRLNDRQIEALVSNAEVLKEKHIISYEPGYLLCQDTFEVGWIKGVGKIYMQAVVDTYGSFGFAKLYTSKISTTAADILVERVIPFYKAMGIKIRNILTDNGREYCGDEIMHDYELVLKIFEIKHRRTKVKHPYTNGYVERFNRTVLEEFFVEAFRKKWYTGVEELQRDLDEWMVGYNYRRGHQGYRSKGRTPAEVLLDVSERPKQLKAGGRK